MKNIFIASSVVFVLGLGSLLLYKFKKYKKNDVDNQEKNVINDAATDANDADESDCELE